MNLQQTIDDLFLSQRIRKKIGDTFILAESLPNYVVFYNGPKCSASAPDHFHLQAGLKMPILLSGDNELRSCLIIESKTRNEAEDRFEDVYRYLHRCQPQEDEPMMNVIAYADQSGCTRYGRTHYHSEGRRFRENHKEDIEDINSQVSMPLT